VPSRDALQRAFVAAASGLGLALAYPRFDLAALAWISLAPVLALALSTGTRAALGWGWLAGLAFFLTLLRWLNFTFRMYSEIPGPLVYLPTVTLAAYCGLYVGLVCGAVAWIARRRGAALALAAVPFLWVAGEWVRGWLMGGFPWGMLGYSQYRVLAVIQIAELGGVYAVSFVVAAVNAAVVALFTTPRRVAAAAAVVCGALVVAALGFGRWRLAEVPAGTARVAVMQPAIEQPVKFDPDHAVRTVQIYVELTRQAAAERPDLLVWPETASPTILRRDPSLLAALRDLSATLGLPLLVGSIDVGDGAAPRYRNSAFLLTDRGLVGRYDKIQLVPFGEYVPLSGALGFVRGWAEFIADLEPGSEPVVFPGPPTPFGVVICYEGIFPALVREFARGGARLMVNMTNDAWFGRTSGPAQHLAMYPFRAVEHRTSVVRAANTGISAFIAPSGRITRRLELFERGTMTERIPLRSRTTLYTRLGDWMAWLSLALSAGALALAATAPRQRGARA
jgi:apolipoprotein N-acyltransferase